MKVPSLSSPLARALETALIGWLPDKIDPGLLPPAEVVPRARTQPSHLDVEVLRANLHAAARHVALGHEGPSFRECSRPACREAANLIPFLEEIEPGATDAELDAILDRVQAALEQGMQPITPRSMPKAARGSTTC